MKNMLLFLIASLALATTAVSAQGDLSAAAKQDMLDLKEAIGRVKDPAAVQTYTTLLRASENHLRAFQRNLDRLGEGYEPIALSAADYQAIISGTNSCAGDCCNKQSGINKTGCQSGTGKGKGSKRQKNTCCAGQ